MSNNTDLYNIQIRIDKILEMIKIDDKNYGTKDISYSSSKNSYSLIYLLACMDGLQTDLKTITKHVDTDLSYFINSMHFSDDPDKRKRNYFLEKYMKHGYINTTDLDLLVSDGVFKYNLYNRAIMAFKYMNAFVGLQKMINIRVNTMY
jgi:hypothetical protein